MLTIIIQMMKIIFGGRFESGGANENALSFKTLFWLINRKTYSAQNEFVRAILQQKIQTEILFSRKYQFEKKIIGKSKF